MAPPAGVRREQIKMSSGGGSTPSAAEYGPHANLIAPLPGGERGVSIVTSASPCGRYFIYCNGQNVIVRDTVDPSLIMVYSEHTHGVKAAKFSPSGKFVASGGAFKRYSPWAPSGLPALSPITPLSRLSLCYPLRRNNRREWQGPCLGMDARGTLAEEGNPCFGG